MLFDGDDAAARVADAKQGAYFHAELLARRDHLQDAIVKRRALIDRRAFASKTRAEVHFAEGEVRHLEKLIARLERRFAAYWASDELSVQPGQLPA